MAAGDIHAHMVLPINPDKTKRTGPAIAGHTTPGATTGTLDALPTAPTTGTVS